MWFFLENHAERRGALAAARVAFTEMTIAKPRAITGLAFPEEEKARVLEILGLSNASLIEFQTDHEEVILLETRTAKVVLESAVNVECWPVIKVILEEYAGLLGVDIIVSNPHGSVSPIKTEEGKLFIRFWSVPCSMQKCRLSGMPDGQNDSCHPSGQGVVFNNPRTSQPWAEAVGGTLYVLFDLPHGPASALMREIMEQYALLQKSPVERERFLAEARQRELAASREAYVRECGVRLKKATDETRKGIEDAVKNQNLYSQKLADAVRAESNLRRKLEQLDEARKGDTPKFGQEFDRLLSVAKVKSVRVADGVVQVFTEHLVTQKLCDGSVRDLGEFRIDIATNGQTPQIFNLTRQVSGHPHPHHRGNSEPCLGNIQEGIAKLAGAYEFSVVAQIMIQFLCVINESDQYGQRISSWPVFKESVATPTERK